MVVRLVESYPAVQGEGPHVGEKTYFVRFGGCNLRCPLWPCDTQYAIDASKYRHEWEKIGAEELLERVVGDVTQHEITNISLSGGEPFLQPKDDMKVIIEGLLDQGLSIDIFSNGTLPYQEYVRREGVHFILDWKMPGSGEDTHNKIRLNNLDVIEGFGSVKFVCADLEDAQQAEEHYHTHVKGRDIPVYYGVAWGKMDNAELVDYVMERNLPWRLNVQVHNYIWDREAREK